MDDSETCKLCGCKCQHEVCESCTDEQMVLSEVRLDYINHESGFAQDWLDYTGELFKESWEPTEIELEFVEDEADEDKWQLCATNKWINEDRSYFKDFLIGRIKQ